MENIGLSCSATGKDQKESNFCRRAEKQIAKVSNWILLDNLDMFPNKSQAATQRGFSL